MSPRYLLFALILCALNVFAAEPLRVVTTIKPLQLIAVAVADGGANVDVLLDPQLSPHDYQLKPSDRVKLEHADVVFWVGPGLELFLERALTSLPSHVRRVALQPDGGHDRDAHIWMNPVAAADIAGQMAEVFAGLRPAQAAVFRANAQRVRNQLLEKDHQLTAVFTAIRSRRAYLVSHDAFAGFEQRYGLHHAAALSDGHERPPGPRHLLMLRDLVTQGEIGCVLLEPQYDRKLVETVVGRSTIKQVQVDSLAGKSEVSAAGLMTFYQDIGETLAQCVRGEI